MYSGKKILLIVHMKKFTLAMVMLISVMAYNATAQQLPLFSQYLFNGFLINPAYAGIDGLTTVNIVSREQWQVCLMHQLHKW